MKKNILLLVHKLSEGGAERVMCELANRLSKEYNVKIVVFNLEEKNYECNVPIINLKSKFGKWSIISNVCKLKKIKKDNNIDCCISALIYSNLINVLSKVNEKTIITIHNKISKQNKGKIVEILHKLSCKKADKIITVSNGIKDDELVNYKIDENKTVAIYNFCNINKIQKLKDGKIDDKIKDIFNGQTIITVGRLVKQKAQDNLIKAFRKLVDKLPNAKLVILGEGKLKVYLNNLIKELKLEDNVYILDFDINPYKYMTNADAFILTSNYEGLPTVILEAMACGLPVISTDCDSGPREILAPKTSIYKKAMDIEYEEYGILLPENYTDNQEKIYKSMLNILGNKELLLKYKNKSRERIIDFDIEKIIKDWEKILEE